MDQTMGNAALANKRTVLRDDIRDAINEAIYTGELGPGDRIIETYWATRLGVSQGPVREAIRELESTGLVETIPYKGSRVRVLSQKDVEDHYSVRITLESKSIEDAISTLSDEALAELCDKLREIVGRMELCALAGDLMNFTSLDTLFHRAIIDATDNQVLLRLWEQCNLRNWYQFSKLTDAESLQQLHSSHQQLTDAIARRDKKAAAEILEEHLTDLMHGYIAEES